MSHFYGIVDGGAKTLATRRGFKTSGLTTEALFENGKIRVRLSYNRETDEDMYIITLTNEGKTRIIEQGKLS